MSVHTDTDQLTTGAVTIKETHWSKTKFEAKLIFLSFKIDPTMEIAKKAQKKVGSLGSLTAQN